MLKSRILSGIIGAVVLFAVVIAGTLPLRIAVGIVSVCMLFELFRAISIEKKLALFIPSAVYVAIVSTALFSHLHNLLSSVLIAILCISFLFDMKNIHITDVGISALFSLLISLFMGCITKIRLMPDGAWLIWFVFIGAWASDIFAYAAGMLFGKHKLIPHVSPGKTIEGSIGGIVGSAGACFVFALCTASKLQIEPYYFIGMGILSSVLGQIGDLVASAIKRQYNIKDYGRIMPGHGGFMDRFDSILFVAPAVLFFLQIIL